MRAPTTMTAGEHKAWTVGLLRGQSEGYEAGRTEAHASGPVPWPDPPDSAAYHGLVGEIARIIEPQTEADPAAILFQTLVTMGATIGRGPHVRVEGDQHHAVLYVIIVGKTSKARKGTSAGRVKEIFSRSRYWPGTVEGLSSGEGLKYHVRDSVERNEEVIDEGVVDKRLLVEESEFAQVLKQAARPGNTLSPVIRTSFDKGVLRSLTKNDPIVATGAHICIMGHITVDELRAQLTATDTCNGFANRFLFTAVRRSKKLPFGGGPISPDALADIGRRIDAAVEHARCLSAVGMTDAAKEIWASVYDELSQDRPGLVGSVTSRMEALALRIALVYALVDCSPEIDTPHLLAALAIVTYAQASATYIFGDSLGDPVADELLGALRRAGNAGMTRLAISNLLGRHQRAERIHAALGLLASRGLATMTVVSTGGRPSEIWRAGANKAKKGDMA